MRDLRTYQQALMEGLLDREDAEATPLEERALRVHRNTILTTLTNALSLSFPTVKRLTGPNFFDELVRAFIREHPPETAVLFDYGAHLPDFLATFRGAENFPYFREVARFDWLLDRIGHQPSSEYRRVLPISGSGYLYLAISLSCEQFDFAVDEIRLAVESEREEALAQLDVRPTTRYLAAWRYEDQVRVKPLREPTWDILRELTTQGDFRASSSDLGIKLSAEFRDEVLGSTLAYLDVEGQS